MFERNKLQDGCRNEHRPRAPRTALPGHRDRSQTVSAWASAPGPGLASFWDRPDFFGGRSPFSSAGGPAAMVPRMRLGQVCTAASREQAGVSNNSPQTPPTDEEERWVYRHAVLPHSPAQAGTRLSSDGADHLAIRRWRFGRRSGRRALRPA
jgi:hypothetical protein